MLVLGRHLGPSSTAISEGKPFAAEFTGGVGRAQQPGALGDFLMG